MKILVEIQDEQITFFFFFYKKVFSRFSAAVTIFERIWCSASNRDDEMRKLHAKFRNFLQTNLEIMRDVTWSRVKSNRAIQNARENGFDFCI